MISSTANQKVRRIKALQKKSKLRYKEGVFIAEGTRLVEETPTNLLDKIYVSEKWLESHSIPSEWSRVETVSEDVMKHMSDTVTPQGVLAIVKIPRYELRDLVADEKSFIVVLDDIRDPGNLGTIFRTAEAAGATGIVLSPDCVDIFLPKSVRSTMGSLYRLPFIIADDLKSVYESLSKNGIKIFAADLDGCDYATVDYTGNIAVVVGNEANGISGVTKKIADTVLSIPMKGKVESLNASMAMGVISFEASRQRRGK